MEEMDRTAMVMTKPRLMNMMPAKPRRRRPSHDNVILKMHDMREGQDVL